MGAVALLASVADRVGARHVASVADVGCGVGTLGLAAAARWGCPAHMFDRDALALAVSVANANANSLAVHLHGALGSRSVVATAAIGPSSGYDLVLCNLPAKAGAPVRGAIIHDCASMLAPGGLFALVVVAPLHGETEATLAAMRGELWQRREPGHAIFHHRADVGDDRGRDRDAAEQREPFAAYVRADGTRTLAGASVPVRSMFGLPDFDTSSYLTQLLASLLAARPAAEWANWRRMWLWNPGQGELASWLVDRRRQQAPNTAPQVSVASRDALQIHATETNLRARGDLLKVTVHAPSPSSAAHELASAVEHAEKADLAVVPLEQDVARAEGERLLVTLAGSLAPGGHLVIGGKAGLVGPLLQRRATAGLSLVKQMRRKGQAAAVCVARA